jgi:hypothetical protein
MLKPPSAFSFAVKATDVLLDVIWDGTIGQGRSTSTLALGEVAFCPESEP